MCIYICINLHVCQAENGSYCNSDQNSRVKIFPPLSVVNYLQGKMTGECSIKTYTFSPGPGLQPHTTHSAYVCVCACVYSSECISYCALSLKFRYSTFYDITLQETFVQSLEITCLSHILHRPFYRLISEIPPEKLNQTHYQFFNFWLQLGNTPSVVISGQRACNEKLEGVPKSLDEAFAT